MHYNARSLLAAAVFLTGLVPAEVAAADYALSADGNNVVRIKPVTAISSTSFDSSLVTSAYSGWTVSEAGLPGSMSTSTYTAGWNGGLGGAQLSARYSQANPIASGSSLNWVQVIDTNRPLGGNGAPYLDPFNNDDTLPFYWTSGEANQFGSSTAVSFKDFSTRDPVYPAGSEEIDWTASLYPALYDGNKSVTVDNGISWGWTMKSATVGNALGVFSSPDPSCPPATCSQIASNRIQWGQGSPGSLAFDGTAYDARVGEVFKIGTLSYHNGSTTAGSEITSVGLDFLMNFTNVPEENFVFSTRLGINNSPNTDDPIASADYVSFAFGGFTQTFNVLEGLSSSVDLMVRLNALLDPTPALFGDKDPLTEPQIPRVRYGLEFVGLANATSGGFIGTDPRAVPEPGVWSMMLAGFGLIGFALRRERAALSLTAMGPVLSIA